MSIDIQYILCTNGSHNDAKSAILGDLLLVRFAVNFDRLPLEYRRTPTNGNDVWWRGILHSFANQDDGFCLRNEQVGAGAYAYLTVSTSSTAWSVNWALLCFDPKNKRQCATRCSPKPALLSLGNERAINSGWIDLRLYLIIYSHFKTPFILSLNPFTPKSDQFTISPVPCSPELNALKFICSYIFSFLKTPFIPSLKGNAVYEKDDGRKVLYLSGIDAWAETPSVDFRTSSFTVALWVKVLAPYESRGHIYSNWALRKQFALYYYQNKKRLTLHARNTAGADLWLIHARYPVTSTQRSRLFSLSSVE